MCCPGASRKADAGKTAIGFYLSGHLFDEVEAEVRRFVRTPIGEMRDSREPQTMAGIIGGLRTINGQRGKLSIFTLDDKSAVIEASVDEKPWLLAPKCSRRTSLSWFRAVCSPTASAAACA
jgi:DNA polymerase-3 subunit alpha